MTSCFMICIVVLCLKEQRTGDQDLSDVVERQVGDTEGELRDPGEGVEDQHDIGCGKQYCADRIDDGSSAWREEGNA